MHNATVLLGHRVHQDLKALRLFHQSAPSETPISSPALITAKTHAFDRVGKFQLKNERTRSAVTNLPSGYVMRRFLVVFSLDILLLLLRSGVIYFPLGSFFLF